MKKILLILNTPPPYGGGEVRGIYLKKYFADNPNYLIYSYSRKKSNKNTQGKILVSNLLWGIYLVLKINYLFIQYRPGKVYFLIPKDFAAFVRNGLIILFANLLNIKVYGDLAGAGFPFLRDSSYLKKKFSRYILRKIHSIKILGENIRNVLAIEGIKNVSIIENGIWVPNSTHLVKNKYFEKPLRLMYVGALNYSKGINRIVESIDLCKQNNLPVHIDILGEWSNPDQENEIMNYIERKKLNELITFWGLVTTEQKWKLYEKNTILVHPSNWDGQPLSILEAMGMGLTVISTYVGAIPDTIKHGENGFLLRKNTGKEVFKAIQQLDKDRNKL